MLIDMLTNADHITNVDPRWVSVLKREAAKAVKFELAPDFAAAAEELASDFRNLKNALPYCRLPFELVWIEVAQQSRPRFAAAPIHVPSVQSIPIRVGFLLRAQNAEMSIIEAYEFWVLHVDPESVQASHMSMTFDPRRASDPREPVIDDESRIFKIGSSEEWIRADPDTKRILNNVIVPSLPAFVDPVIKRSFDDDKSTLGQVTWELGAADWSGESAYLLAVLALLNTLNATERTLVDRGKLNKQRLKGNKPMLNDHYVITIHPRIKRTMVNRGRGASAEERTAHFVRGHFKVRKTGIYWWRPFTRGVGDKPTDKSYRVD